MKRKPVESARDFKDRITAKIHGISVEQIVLTRKLRRAEAFGKYMKMVTRTKTDRGYSK